MASQEVTVQDNFSAGMPAIKETANKALAKRQLPQRDYQGKFVERNTGLMLNALGNIYSQLRQLVALTQESLNIQKGDEIQEQQQLRNESLAGAEADPEKTTKEKGPGFMSKGWKNLKGAFSKIKESPSVMLAILLGGLALLSKYSENLIGPLANLLEWFDKNGMPGIEKVLLKAKKWAIDKLFEFVAELEQFFANFGTDGKYRLKIEAFVATMKTLFEQVEKLMLWVQGKYQAFVDWKKKFDVDESGTGTGGLDPEEWDAVVEEIKEIAVEHIGKFMKGVLLGLGGLLLTATFIKETVKLAFASPAIRTIFGASGLASAPGKASAGTVAATRASMLSGSTIPILGMLLYGITTTYKNVTDSMEKAINDQGEVDVSDFVAHFLGGKKDGGIMNAFGQAFKVGGTGTLIGMGIGAIGGPPGIILGGLLGMASGALLGAVTGYAGSDKMKIMTDGFSSMLESAGTTISNFFSDTVEGFKALVRGENFDEAFAKRGEGDMSALNLELEQAKARLERTKEKIRLGKRLVVGENVGRQQKNIARLEALLKAAPVKGQVNTLDKEIEELRFKENQLKNWIGQRTRKAKPRFHTEANLLAKQEALADVQAQIAEKELTISALESGATPLPNIQAQIKNIQGILETRAGNFETGANLALTTGNKVNADNTNVKTDNVYAGGFTYSHSNTTAQALSRTRGFALGYHGL